MYNANMDVYMNMNVQCKNGCITIIKYTLTLELFRNDLSPPLSLQLLRTFVPLLSRHRVKTLEAMPTLP